MAVVAVLLSLHLPGVTSLKEKRAVVRSLVERLRSRLNVAAAEVGLQDQLQHAEIGFSTVSEELTTARRLAEEARRFADDELLGNAEVIATEIEELVIESRR